MEDCEVSEGIATLIRRSNPLSSLHSQQAIWRPGSCLRTRDQRSHHDFAPIHEHREQDVPGNAPRGRRNQIIDGFVGVLVVLEYRFIFTQISFQIHTKYIFPTQLGTSIFSPKNI
jgi:hypothetical protein